MVWCAPTIKEGYVVTCPPGPLGLTIKQFEDEWIVVDTVYEFMSNHPAGKVRPLDTIVTIDGKKIETEEDIPSECEKDTEIGVGEYVMTMDASHLSKGMLLAMKYTNCAKFRILDYSNVAQKYGEDFLDELDPPQRKSGNQLLAEAFTAIGNAFPDES